MIRALHTAASGMMAQQTNLDNIANNLANSNTVAFQRRRVQFEDVLYQNVIAPGSPASQQTVAPNGLQLGLGTRSASTELITAQGDIKQTGNPLDLTIKGRGYFQVKLPNGETAYTRAGNFSLNAQGELVTADGNPVEPSITIPADATSVSVGADGTVSVIQPGQAAAQEVGKIELATFANPAGLSALGGNVFQATSASGDAVTGAPGGAEGIGELQQGALEGANVNVAQEFIDMILAQRSYESNSRVIRAADEMLQNLNNLGR